MDSCEPEPGIREFLLFTYKLNYRYLHRYSDDRITWRVAVIPRFFLDSLFQRGKSGDKGEAYASDAAFFQGG